MKPLKNYDLHRHLNVELTEFIKHQRLCLFLVEATETSPNQRDGNRRETLFMGQSHGILNGIPNRPVRRPSEHIDPSDVDDSFEWHFFLLSQDCTTKRDRTMP